MMTGTATVLSKKMFFFDGMKNLLIYKAYDLFKGKTFNKWLQ